MLRERELPPLMLPYNRMNVVAVCLLWLGLAVVLVPLIGLLYAYNDEVRDFDMRLWVLFWVGAVFGVVVALLFAVWSLAQLATRRSALIIRHEGIEPLDYGFLGWDDIVRLEVKREGLLRSLVISPRDPEAVIARLRGRRRRQALVALRAGQSPVKVPLLYLPLDEDELREEIKRYLPLDKTLLLLFGR